MWVTMDYEFRIKLAEKELAHLKEMQDIMRTHQDVHDASFAAVNTTLDRIEGILEKLSVAQLATEQKLQSLIDVLLRDHSNGGRSK
jgi:hypothetical protein